MLLSLALASLVAAGHGRVASQRASAPVEAASDPFVAPAESFAQENAAIPSNPAEQAKMPRVSARELHTLMAHKRVLVVDSRDAFSYRATHIRGAISVPLFQLNSEYRLLPKDRLIALYCT